MTREELIENIAKAMFNARCGNPEGINPFRAVPPHERLEDLRDAKAALAAIEEAGYAVVPKNPTEEMILYGMLAHANYDHHNGKSEKDRLFITYTAMLAASPLKEPTMAEKTIGMTAAYGYSNPAAVNSPDKWEAAATAVWNEAVEACMQAIKKEHETFSSTEYATDQPHSSFGERFACNSCIEAVRSLKRSDKDTDNG